MARCAIEAGPSQSRSAGAARRDSQGGAPRRGRPAEIYVPSSSHRRRDLFMHTPYSIQIAIRKIATVPPPHSDPRATTWDPTVLRTAPPNPVIMILIGCEALENDVVSPHPPGECSHVPGHSIPSPPSLRSAPGEAVEPQARNLSGLGVGGFLVTVLGTCTL